MRVGKKLGEKSEFLGTFLTEQTLAGQMQAERMQAGPTWVEQMQAGRTQVGQIQVSSCDCNLGSILLTTNSLLVVAYLLQTGGFSWL